MDPQAAGELVEAWLVAPGHLATGGVKEHGPVSRAVRALAPDAERTGVGQTEDGPAMAVLLGDALLVMHARRGKPGDAAPAVVARRLRLDPATTELELVERYEERGDGDGRRLVRAREWRLSAGAHELLLHGTEIVSGGPRDELGRPDDNESLARAIAEALGWRLP